MNIIYVTSSNTASGGSRQALYTAQGLAARGHDLRFFVPTGAALPGLAPHLHWEELPARRSDWGAAISRTLPPETPPFVVHAFHNKAVKMAAWQGLFWHGRGGVVAAQRGVIYKPNNPLPYWSPGIDCFVANSQACASVLRAKGVGDKRLHVVYNGIPRERVTPQRSLRAMRGILNLPDQALVFGCVANDSANKGGALLLRAFAEANIPHARLLLLGVSPDAYAPIAAELGIADRVQLPGKQECVADYLQVCHAFALPSLSESMPNTLQEAVCMGAARAGQQRSGECRNASRATDFCSLPEMYGPLPRDWPAWPVNTSNARNGPPQVANWPRFSAWSARCCAWRNSTACISADAGGTAHDSATRRPRRHGA